MNTKKNNSKKLIVLLLVLMLLIGSVIGGTVAFLMTKTDPVTNTFVAGNIGVLTLTESDTAVKTADGKNTYVIIPGKNITKDPKVSYTPAVANDLGEVYIFVAPDAVDTELVNSASKLRFTFTNTAGQVCEYTNYLTSKLTAGVMTNLGSINTIRYRESGQYVVSGGENWAKLNQKKDIIEGSALDFSAFSVDAPAGKYGALKAVGTHFEFAQLPGAEQYFYGANLTTTACAPEKTKSDMVAARMARIGYNTVRLHHYDDLWAANENDSKLEGLKVYNLQKLNYCFIGNKKYKKYYMLEMFYGARKQVFFTFGPYVLILFYGANAATISLLFAVSAISQTSERHKSD